MGGRRDDYPVISLEETEGILRMVWQDGDYVKLKLRVSKRNGSGYVWDKIFGNASSPSFELHASAKRAVIASVEGEKKLRKMIQESLDCVMPYWSVAARDEDREAWHRALLSFTCAMDGWMDGWVAQFFLFFFTCFCISIIMSITGLPLCKWCLELSFTAYSLLLSYSKV